MKINYQKIGIVVLIISHIILIGIVFYTLREPASTSPNLDHFINQLKEENAKSLLENEKIYQVKFDSISNSIKLVDQGITELKAKENIIKLYYNNERASLKNKSIDSLKIIALLK
jgi:uncharacterized membrane protein YwzB